MPSNRLMGWDQRYLVDMAQVAREGFHIKLEVRRRFNARLVAEAQRALAAKRRQLLPA
jgi:hypothetical protein